MKILSFLALSYYCMALMIFFGLVALVISIKYYGRHKNLRIFTYYIAFSLLVTMADFYEFASPPGGVVPRILLIVISNVFMVFEFVACNLFILHCIDSPLRRRIIRFNGLLFFGLLIYVWIITYRVFLQASYFLLESIFLIVPCLIYFYELFQTVNQKPLKDRPSFWVTTGFLFLNASSIPLLMTLRYLGHYLDAAFSLNYILYSLLFILLIRAYFCSPQSRSAYE